MNRIKYILLVVLLFITSCTPIVEEVIEPVEPDPIEMVEEIEEEEPKTLVVKYKQQELYRQYYEAQNEPHESIPEEIILTEFVVGRIVIPVAEVDLITIGGINSYDPVYLNESPVHFEASDFPRTTPSNMVIMGHRTNPSHFYKIDTLEEGDNIYLDIEGYRFVYEVMWQEIVSEYEWSIINENPDYPAISLMTCEPPWDANAAYRLFVRGKLVDVEIAPIVNK